MLMQTLMMLMLMRDKTESASCRSIRNRLFSTVIFAATLFSTGSWRLRRSLFATSLFSTGSLLLLLFSGLHGWLRR